MKINSKFALIFPVMAVFSGSAYGATVFQLDFDNGSSAVSDRTQAGWQAFSDSTDQNNKTEVYAGFTDLSAGNISITTTGVQFTRNTNNGNLLTNLPGTDQDRLYNDLILRNAAGAIDISVSGLRAGTYVFTTHHLVQGGSTSSPNDFNLLVQDANSPVFGQNVGNYLMGKGQSDFFEPTALVFEVVSNGTDPVIVRVDIPAPLGGGQGAWVGINGLEIAPIPEPSSLGLLGLGSLLLLARRRR